MQREQKELEKKYKSEIRVERGDVTPSSMSEDISVKDFTQKKLEFAKPITPKRTEIKEFLKYEPPKLKDDVWHSRSDLIGQHSALKDIISKLKQEATRSNDERMDALQELDKLKEELHQKTLINAQKNQFNIASSFKPYYYSNPVIQTQQNFAYSSHHINSESQFIPYQKSPEISNTMPKNPYKSQSFVNEYSHIESEDVKTQLENLDNLLKFGLKSPLNDDKNYSFEIKSESIFEQI